MKSYETAKPLSASSSFFFFFFFFKKYALFLGLFDFGHSPEYVGIICVQAGTVTSSDASARKWTPPPKPPSLSLPLVKHQLPIPPSPRLLFSFFFF